MDWARVFAIVCFWIFLGGLAIIILSAFVMAAWEHYLDFKQEKEIERNRKRRVAEQERDQS